jgi:hypothetical protein
MSRTFLIAAAVLACAAAGCGSGAVPAEPPAVMVTKIEAPPRPGPPTPDYKPGQSVPPTPDDKPGR